MTELRGGADAGQAATWAGSRKVAQVHLPPGLNPAQQKRAVRSAAVAIRRWSAQIGGINWPPAPGSLSPNPSSLSFSLPFLSQQPTALESLLAVADVLPFPAGHLLAFSFSQTMSCPAAKTTAAAAKALGGRRKWRPAGPIAGARAPRGG